MKEISIHDIFKLLRKHIPLLIIVPLIVTLITAIYMYGFVDNSYTAKCVMYILRTYDDSANSQQIDLNSSLQFATDYKELITAETVINRTEAQLGSQDLKKEVDITVDAVSNTRIINLTVVGKDPARCAQVANVLSSTFVNYIAELTGVNAVTIADPASTPERPSGPSRARNTLLMLIVSFVLVAGVLIAIDMLDNTLRTDSDVSDFLQLPVLADVVGYHDEMDAFRDTAKKKRTSLYSVVSDATRESIKSLSTNIQFCAIEKPIKTLLMTSTIPNEGKSSLSVMLASALAEEHKRVLLVDMDFRNPSVGKLLRQRSPWDLVSYFSHEKSLDEIINISPETGVHFIDNAHKNAIPTNIMKLGSFDNFIKEVGQDYDMVIFDAPPLSVFIDAAILSSKVDGTMLVVGSGKADREAVKEVTEQFTKAHANVLGVVLNFVARADKSASYYYQRYSEDGKQHHSSSHRHPAR